MADYSDLKLALLDELCDKLDESGIEGNVIERDFCGTPYVSIWYGDFEDYPKKLSERFNVLVTDDGLYYDVRGRYEIKPPEKYRDYFKDCYTEYSNGRSGFYVMGSEKIVRTIKFLFNREKMEKKKENNMNEFTLENGLFNKLKENKIYYKFIDGVYDPERVIIVTKTNYNICAVRSIPNSESSKWAYEVNWFMPLRILTDLKLDKVKRYEFSSPLIMDILRAIEKTSATPRDVFSYAEADVLATEALYKYREFSIVDVIFNDPATIIIWADGTKTVVKAENEKFDPEKGLAMAISKKVLGNKYDYYEVFKKYVGRYEKKQAKKAKKEN